MKLLPVLIFVMITIGMIAVPASAFACAIPVGMSDTARTRRSMFVHPSIRTLKLQVRENWKR